MIPCISLSFLSLKKYISTYANAKGKIVTKVKILENSMLNFIFENQKMLNSD